MIGMLFPLILSPFTVLSYRDVIGTLLSLQPLRLRTRGTLQEGFSAHKGLACVFWISLAHMRGCRSPVYPRTFHAIYPRSGLSELATWKPSSFLS